MSAGEQTTELLNSLERLRIHRLVVPARQVLVLEEVAEDSYVLHYDTHLARYRDWVI